MVALFEVMIIKLPDRVASFSLMLSLSVAFLQSLALIFSKERKPLCRGKVGTIKVKYVSLQKLL
eukprot:snap_masked-scaffold_36-processed-gene-2.52-mRNA-1 protein AED:1.00 eAED:1.00 QI:0/0/0/0/1/1/3/0/63